MTAAKQFRREVIVMLADDERSLYPQTVFPAQWHRMGDMIRTSHLRQGHQKACIPELATWTVLAILMTCRLG